MADDPLSSYLLCHADNEQDGQLTAAEILQSKVEAQLVVLSVCYSGLGDRSPLPGDDLFGLQRSLLEAGALNVVAGVWDVYDATGAQLMELFLEQIKQGQAAPVALAAAQREFVKRQRAEGPANPWIHPYFWAVYKSTGSDLTRMGSGK